MSSTVGPVYETIMGVLGIVMAAVWLFLIWRSVRSGLVWGWDWSAGPRRDQRPTTFWFCMLTFLALAIGFAWRGVTRL